jgi:hypothetical protein
MTDSRALLAEMADALDQYLQGLFDNRSLTHYLSDRARAALAQPESVGPTDEELLAVQAEGTVTFPPSHPEAEALSVCEYYKQLEIRKGRAVLARWGRPAIAPIPLSERLPEAEDCDAEGRCWFWEPDCDYNGLKWALVDRTYGCNTQESVFTHWLPAHALPLPSPSDHH